MKGLIRDSLFQFGLLVRLLLICFAIPLTQQEWFVPFLSWFVTSPSFDPWASFLANGGSALAFPYGPVMLLAYTPLSALAALGVVVLRFTGPMIESNYLWFIAFGLSALAFEIFLFLGMNKILKNSQAKLINYLWLSPMPIYVCYWHGQTDIIPVTLLILSLFALRQDKATLGGVLFGAGVASKLSVLLAAPFVLIYLLRNKRNQWLAKPFVVALSITCFLGTLCFAALPGYREMVLGSREFQKVYSLAVELGGGTKVFILPLFYSLVLYAAWRIERMSFDLFLAFLGLAFFSVLLLTPASTGWYLWVLPFVVAIQLRSSRTTMLLGVAFGWVFVVTNLIFASGAALPAFGLDFQRPLLEANTDQTIFLHSLLLSVQCTLAVLFCLQMVIHGVRRSDYFRLSRRPIVIGIAGDSGAGKDTLASAVAGLFGHECVTNICGDDYHKWDRHAPMWNVVTHLDPRANDLAKFSRDVTNILDGKRVLSRHYDHAIGRFRRDQAVQKNDVVIVSGLHALYVASVERRLDLSIYLDMDPSLRTHFKVQRDVHQRGKAIDSVLLSIAERQPDADMYIKPQADKADVVFSLAPANSNDIERSVRESRYRLDVSFKNGVSSDPIIRTLIGLSDMQVDTNPLDEYGRVKISIEGEINAEDIEMAASPIAREMEELLSRAPDWKGGMLGLMQYISLSQMYESLQIRLSHAY